MTATGRGTLQGPPLVAEPSHGRHAHAGPGTGQFQVPVCAQRERGRRGQVRGADGGQTGRRATTVLAPPASGD